MVFDCIPVIIIVIVVFGCGRYIGDDADGMHGHDRSLVYYHNSDKLRHSLVVVIVIIVVLWWSSS